MGFGGSGGGGSSTIAGSSDAALNNPVNNDVLAYNSTTQKWSNSQISGGPTGIDGLPAGTTLTVAYTAGSWPNRPTARTDILVQWIDVTGAAPVPPTALVGDLVIRDVS